MKPETKTWQCDDGCDDDGCEYRCIVTCHVDAEPDMCVEDRCVEDGAHQVWTEVKKCSQCGEYIPAEHCGDICNDCYTKFHHDDSEGEVPGVAFQAECAFCGDGNLIAALGGEMWEALPDGRFLHNKNTSPNGYTMFGFCSALCREKYGKDNPFLPNFLSEKQEDSVTVMTSDEFAEEYRHKDGSPKPLMIGKVYEHPDGRKVRITSGNYEVDHRISNFWYWDFVDDDFKSTGETGHGYGWMDRPLPEKRDTVPTPCTSSSDDMAFEGRAIRYSDSDPGVDRFREGWDYVVDTAKALWKGAFGWKKED